MDRQSMYLYERRFHSPSGHIQPDPGRVEFWRKNIGESFLQELCRYIPEAAAHIFGLPYDVEEETEKSVTGRATRIKEDYKRLESEKMKLCRQKAENFVAEHPAENFICFYREYLAEALCQFVEKGGCDLEGEVYDEYLLSLLRKLEHICIRVLIYEIQSSKTKGELKGRDSREEYEFFCRYVITKEWIKQIEEKYPVLKRSVYEAIDAVSDLYAGALRRLREDHQAVTEELCGGKEFRKVIRIDGDMGDSHRGGNSVLKFWLDNGMAVIYKPHSLENEEKFDEFSEKIGTGCGISMYHLPRVCRENYGWAACVEQKGCHTREELERFYRRTGIYMFLFYLLGTNDIHSENIIACKEYPVVIDLENITGMPNESSESNIMEKVKQYLHTSVLYSGMLPAAKWQQEQGNVNISGIGGGKSAKMPFKVPRVVNGGSSDIRISYEHPRYTPDQNAPLYRGKYINPAEYKEQIVQGFEDAYRYAVRNQTEMEQQISELKDTKSRYLLADTQRYSMCLNSSYHPSLLSDGADRQMYLYTIGYGRKLGQAEKQEMVRREVKDMAGHDIPYFYFHTGERHLYDSRNEPVKDYFRRTAYEVILERLKNLHERDLYHQKYLISVTLNLQCDLPINKNKEEVPQTDGNEPSKEQYLEMAEHIMEEVCARAVDFGEEIGWYTVNVASAGNSGWKVEPLPMYLYGGVMGICLVSHLLEKYTEKEKYKKINEMLDRQLFSYTEQLEGMELKQLQIGIYNGEMSIVYGYLCLYQITGDIRYLGYAKRHADLVIPAIGQEENCDLLDGLAGVVWGMAMLYEKTGESRYCKAVKEAGDRLCEKAIHKTMGIGWKTGGEEEILLGISHGNAGIAAAIAKLYEMFREEKYAIMLEQSVTYENCHYNTKIKNWIDFRVKDEAVRKTTDTSAWCHGAGGILASRLMIKGKVDGGLLNVIENNIEQAGSKLVQKCLRDGMCLCHGSCGNLLLLMEYEKHKRTENTYIFSAADERKPVDKEEKEKLHRIIQGYDNWIMEKLTDENFELLLQERYNPGLMNGYTGIAYYMLKRYDDTIFDILKLE